MSKGTGTDDYEVNQGGAQDSFIDRIPNPERYYESVLTEAPLFTMPGIEKLYPNEPITDRLLRCIKRVDY